MKKIVLLLRVKDGVLFIKNWLSINGSIVDEIVVVDNGSTDGTYEILKEHPKVVSIIRTEGFDEGRDLNLVYNEALKRNPDWCINLDVDEFFEARVTYEKLHQLINTKIFSYIRFRRFHFFFDDKHYGAGDHNFWELTRPSRKIWNVKEGLQFPKRKIHCASIEGLKGLFKISSFRILHLCNLEVDYRLNAYENYKAVDPEHKDFYEWQAKKINDKEMTLWKWHEYKEKPFRVITLHIFLNIMYIFYMSLKPFMQLTKKY